MRSIFIILLAFLLANMGCGPCSPKNLRRDAFPVTAVLNGSQVQLINGYVINLLGIEASPESENYLKKEVLNHDVKLVFDSHSPLYQMGMGSAVTGEVFAYVINDRGICINSDILDHGISKISIIPYLTDSLEPYIAMAGRYAQIAISKKDELEGQEVKAAIDTLFQEVIDACDYMNPATRNLAVRIAGQHTGEFNIEQVIDIFDSVRPPKWKYVNDPRGVEFFSSASNTILNTNLTGDCDDFAILMYSLLTSIGGQARISFAQNKYMGHAFTELNIRDIPPKTFFQTMYSRFPEFSIDSLHYKIEGESVWLNLDWWAAYPGGKYMDYQWRFIFYPAEHQYSIEDRTGGI